MNRTRNLISIGLLAFAAAACDSDSLSSNRITLPEGSVTAGQELFVNLQCTACHTISGMDLPEADIERPYHFELGGRATRVKSYEDLVTSIINPSHKVAVGYSGPNGEAVSESPMAVYNDVLTVTDLINLVTFLQTRYEVIPTRTYRYVRYPD